MKRERSESESHATEVESLKAKIAGINALLRDAEDRIALQMEDLVKKIEYQTSQVDLLRNCMEYHTREIAVTKARVEDTEIQVTDLENVCELNYQRSRALEISIQKVADASPANPQVEVQYEIENFTDERYHYYSVACEAARNGQVPVLDPQLGS
ncbi:uncharacterized protein MELLADRAFT_101656 [Melampsora larici-populina 98AG31]|uniref:Uncharacterized protein n=1 Tax=Melampsora larici-populina (strain 98AG31 / pathotype 3-4-7) TaxID=747676 RepID=F4R6J5_MELLP|nr:uncharacterized protein MELLADRAFT_101656 [Melampsora larici-populina 98AG31]EGG12454.1 hypothetical protein MELLADRAFT_101656 [Melampsora larici-populina 98AG31]